MNTKDRQLLKKAENLIPWATQTNAKRWYTGYDAMPVFLSRAKGSRVWDTAGKEYIDFDASLGPIILGYQYPAVEAAVKKQMKDGIVFPMASPLEIEAAEKVKGVVPCAARVRFLKTGGSANLAAIRLARAVTGREKIVITSYHGWQDNLCPQRPGVPAAIRRLSLQCPFGDIQSLEKAFKKHGESIAGVLTVPYDWVYPAPGEYLKAARRITKEYGALLLYDEVLTGFRMALGGGQEYFGITPDLAVFGKAVANGYPLSVFAGRAQVMDKGLDTTVVTTTNAGDALSLAAVCATIDVMRKNAVHKHIWTLGSKLMKGLDDLFTQAGIPGVSQGMAPKFTTVFRTGKEEKRSLRKKFICGLMKQGIFYCRAWFVTYSHTNKDIARTLETARKIIKKL